jgi:hypothetical protein
MRALGVVVGGPVNDHNTRMSQVAEHGIIEQLVAHPAVETLDEAVLHWPSRRVAVPLDPMLGTRPQDGGRC